MSYPNLCDGPAKIREVPHHHRFGHWIITMHGNHVHICDGCLTEVKKLPSWRYVTDITPVPLRKFDGHPRARRERALLAAQIAARADTT